MATFHAELHAARPRWTPAQAADLRLDAARRGASVPDYPAGLSAATIVGHGSEPRYVLRAIDRITRAIGQLPPEDECWVGLYWSNGAPVDDVVAAIDWSALPEHVAGIVFVGAVLAFPHRNLDVFQIMAPRGLEPGAESNCESTISPAFAEAVLTRAEQSSGVRASVVRGVRRGKRRQLLRRDGRERLSPFNLVLDRDFAPGMARGSAA